MITSNDLLVALGGEPLPQDITFSAVVQDSRLVRPGSLFVALRGETQDGHAFIAEALQRGAAGILAERVPAGLAAMPTWTAEPGTWNLKPGTWNTAGFLVKNSLQALQQLAAYWRSRCNVEVIGVTGSVGKTSTKEMIAAVLAQRFRVLKNAKNLNNEIGLPLSVLQLTSDHQKAVLEMGMYDVGEIRLLCQIARPKIGVVTNVGPSHLERLGSLERIALAKSELVQALPADGMAILNGDDPLVRAMASQMKGDVLLYGHQRNFDLWADEVKSHGLEGIRLRLHRGKEAVSLRIPLLGGHNVHTVLAAAAVGLVEGLSWQEIGAGLSVTPEQLRLVIVPGFHGATLIDDTYNSSPASALAALNLLAEMEGRRVAVLGDMLELGDYENEGHQQVGRRAAQIVARLVAVGPRGRLIGQAALDAGMDADGVAFAANNAEAVDHLQGILQPGDYVLIKGSRGLKMEEIVAQVRAA